MSMIVACCSRTTPRTESVLVTYIVHLSILIVLASFSSMFLVILTFFPVSRQTAGTTPGSVIPLVTPVRSSAPILDSSHPAAGIPLRQLKLPKWACPHFSVNAYPKALLHERELAYDEHLPPYNVERYPPEPKTSGKRQKDSDGRRVNFSMQTTFFSKWVQVDAVRRSVIKRKMKHAAELVITKGANVQNIAEQVGEYGEVIVGSQKIVFDENETGEEKWLIPGACPLRSYCRLGRFLAGVSG